MSTWFPSWHYGNFPGCRCSKLGAYGEEKVLFPATTQVQGYRPMKCPLHVMMDCQVQHYYLQLNTYRHILTTRYGLTIVDMIIVGLHPGSEANRVDQAVVIHAPFLIAETNAMIEDLALSSRKQ